MNSGTDLSSCGWFLHQESVHICQRRRWNLQLGFIFRSNISKSALSCLVHLHCLRLKVASSSPAWSTERPRCHSFHFLICQRNRLVGRSMQKQHAETFLLKSGKLRSELLMALFSMTPLFSSTLLSACFFLSSFFSSSTFTFLVCVFCHLTPMTCFHAPSLATGAFACRRKTGKAEERSTLYLHTQCAKRRPL